ncbi:MAG TPA: DsrE family protein [Candidatus Limiplasma sp.]|nr:DsrE family protein [Candidatus Limiplasma sp.]HRX07578.1 DsrE family protein [Candidatus Limiplasma sp.]
MDEKNTLHILWTTGEVETSLHMVLMYATRCMAYHLWDKVVVIIWGSADLLAASNEQVREAIKLAMHEGVAFTACVACARQLGVTEQLEVLGVELTGWGPPLTKLLKNNEALLTV